VVCALQLKTYTMYAGKQLESNKIDEIVKKKKDVLL
jgi:hypothetical protein